MSERPCVICGVGIESGFRSEIRVDTRPMKDPTLHSVHASCLAGSRCKRCDRPVTTDQILHFNGLEPPYSLLHLRCINPGSGLLKPENWTYRHGFTLVELLVVILIIVLVSVATMPTVIEAMRERQVVSAAQLIQASIMGARDAATAAGAPRGIRLLPDGPVARLEDGSVDPGVPLVCSKVIPLAVPPAYQEGRVSIYPGTAYPVALTGGRPCLVLEESPGKWVSDGGGYAWVLNSPTSWAWNLRAGEKVTFGSGGTQYVIVGPIIADNPEQFVSYGPPGRGSGFARDYPSPDAGQSVRANPEILLLVNGRDDDGDGYVDNGWDGLDNDADGAVDELDEWVEVEAWIGNPAAPVLDEPYRVRRRAVPAQGQQPIDMASPAVIDLTGWGGTPERSRCVVDRYSGAVNILVGPDGRWTYDLPYSGTSAVGMDAASFVHLWIGSRADISGPASPMPPPKEDAKLLTINRAGLVSILDVNPDDPARTFLDARRGTR